MADPDKILMGNLARALARVEKEGRYPHPTLEQATSRLFGNAFKDPGLPAPAFDLLMGRIAARWFVFARAKQAMSAVQCT